MSKTLEQLQSYQEHYIANYPRATPRGKGIIRYQLIKLKHQINRLKRNGDQQSAVQVIVNKFATRT